MSTKLEVESIQHQFKLQPVLLKDDQGHVLDKGFSVNEADIDVQVRKSLAELKPQEPIFCRTTRTVEEGTTLDAILSNLPWEDRFSYGAGVNAITSEACGSALKTVAPVDAGSLKSKEIYRFISSKSDYEQEISGSVSGMYNMEGTKITGSASYLASVEYSDMTMTLIASFESERNAYNSPNTFTLTDQAAKLISKPEEFRRAFGDYFIAGAKTGSTFYATYICRAQSLSHMNNFKAELGAEAPQVFSAKGSATFMEKASANNISLTVEIYMNGYNGQPPSGPWTPEAVLQALEWFKANMTGTPLKTKLHHYSTLEPSYPRNIEVSPDDFIELRKLYSDVWLVRSRYATCPTEYKDGLREKFQTVNYGVSAYQSILATDINKRKGFYELAKSLLTSIEDIFKRRDFYNKVISKKTSEPKKGKWHEEKSDGSHTWLYGYNRSHESSAILIRKYPLKYKDDWHIGWREKNLEYKNNESMIVGWEVVANWRDGTCGQWKKTVNNIIGESKSGVYVKSLYDRGTNWTVNIFFVDKKDYQF